MTEFWKASALVLLTVILGAAVGKTEKDITVVLTIAACCAVAGTAIRYLSDVVDFLWELGSLSNVHNPYFSTLLRITGVVLITEVTGLISSDAGNSSLGKVMQILGNAAILFLSLPMMETFIAMIQEILGVL